MNRLTMQNPRLTDSSWSGLMTIMPGRTFFVGILGSAFRLSCEWRQRREYRQDLSRLTESGHHLIRDIGLEYHEAKREIAKPFWMA